MSPRRRLDSIPVARLVEVLSIGPFPVLSPNDEPLILRIEIWQVGQRSFESRAWKEDTFKIRPAYGSSSVRRVLWDVRLLGRDHEPPWEVRGRSKRAVVEKTLKAIEHALSVELTLPKSAAPEKEVASRRSNQKDTRRGRGS